MIKLINGNGQIGDILKKKMHLVNVHKYTYIYHTWNIEDKSEETQRKEYKKFINFVNKYKHNRIIFISTTSQKESEYVKYKQISESFLIENCKDCVVLKFPTLIGKGVFYDFKNGTKQPHAEMEIMSLEQAVDKILEKINYSGLLKSFCFKGHTIDANLVYEMVRL